MARAVPAWMTNRIQARFGLRLRNGHDGAVCASREAAVKLGTILKWAAIAFLLWWIIQEPTNAAHLVHNIGTFLSNAASGLSHFVASI
jgi:hypothetical protein